MSFSQRCKKEINRNFENVDLDYNASLREIFSYTRLAANMRISDNKLFLDYDIFFNHQAKRLYNLIKFVYGYSSTIEITKVNKFGRNKIYNVIIEDENISDKIIRFTDLLNASYDDIRETYLKEDETRRVFLKCAFLLYGSINDPKRGYYLEISIPNRFNIKLVKDVLDSYDLNPRLYYKNDNGIVYLKNSDKISEFLCIVSAYRSLLELEDVKAFKSIRNDVNRQTNCENANIDRLVKASISQIEDIKKIIENEKFDNLSSDLKQIALLRLENPYVSLEQLGLLSNPVLNKSKVNYRLKKISKIAQNL